MHRVVHGAKEHTRWRCCRVGEPSVQQDGNVMVPMQKDERLFVNNDEKSVKQLSVRNKNSKNNIILTSLLS